MLSLRRPRRSPDRYGSAAAIRNLIDSADEPAAYWRAQGLEPPLRSAAVLAAREDLLAVAAALESDDELAPQLLECARWLAWSPESPVCSDPGDADSDVPRVAARLREAMT
jgi:hypothetical protein